MIIKKYCQKRFALLLIGLLSVWITACGTEPVIKKPIADLIITGAKIYTVNDKQPWASSVAIKDGRFIYVGDNEGSAVFRGAATSVIDLEGRFVMPGMIDSHTHPGYIGVEQYVPLQLSGEGPEDLLNAIKDYADNNPGDGWIRVCCWSSADYIKNGKGPHKKILDAIVNDRPVWITSMAWHSYWLNSKGLETLGIDQDTPDPTPSLAEYVRDENGALTGWVKEGAGWKHFASQFPIKDQILFREKIKAFLQTLSENGVTTVYDGGNFGFEDDVYGFLAELEKSGNLPLRYEGTTQIFVPEARHKAIAEMKRLRAAYGGDKLRFRTIKLFMDGITENRSSAFLENFSDTPNHVGSTTLTVAELRDFLLELHKEKFDLHIHTIGDKAVRDVLDSVEAAKKIVGSDFYPRVSVAHIQKVDPADWPRFAELNVSANFTPWWHSGISKREILALGEKRVANTFNAQPIFEAGGNVTFSSDDWRLNILTPFLGIETGHNRQAPSKPEKPFQPPASARLDLELMVKGYTLNGAYPFRMENQIGSIVVGKLADLVVLDENLFEMDPYQIHKIKPKAVIMEGELIQGKLE